MECFIVVFLGAETALIKNYLQTPNNSSCNNFKLSDGEITGVAVGCLVLSVILILVFIIITIRIRLKNNFNEN
ncbi:MAG: hypothetical protein K2H56_04220 [Malacoplasma sp.]|nr:hypothetical protein [Malacoplasma sp.]